MRENGFGAVGEGGLPGGGDIRVDEEGDWFHGGTKIVREDIIELFLENLSLGPDGKYEIEWRGSRCLIDAADTPFVVTRVDREEAPDAGAETLRLSLKHLPSRELLAPETLIVGPANILYCRVQDGRFPARFSRPAYYQLAEWIVEDESSGSYFLELGRTRHRIRGTA
ncbi:MAG: hypothetical protein AB9873_06115 [Syntrophobacteraceae bacterium]